MTGSASAQGRTGPAHPPLNFPGRFPFRTPNFRCRLRPRCPSDPAKPPLNSRVGFHFGAPMTDSASAQGRTARRTRR